MTHVENKIRVEVFHQHIARMYRRGEEFQNMDEVRNPEGWLLCAHELQYAAKVVGHKAYMRAITSLIRGHKARRSYADWKLRLIPKLSRSCAVCYRTISIGNSNEASCVHCGTEYTYHHKCVGEAIDGDGEATCCHLCGTRELHD